MQAQAAVQAATQAATQATESKKHIISSDTEYYLLDKNNHPIDMNKYFSNFLDSSHEQPILINNKLNKKQKDIPKLSHPNEETNIVENISDNEDNNIITQDLTHEEIEELKQQLDLMQRKQTGSITAENDENNNQDAF